METTDAPFGDTARQEIFANIAKYGCHLTMIEADDYLPGFVYSIGLFERFGHPEIICFGLKTEVMVNLINHACDIIKQGKQLVTETSYYDFLREYPVQFVNVNKDYYQNYLGYAGWFYQSGFDFPVLQLVWTDKEGKFPWEEGFAEALLFKQPLLDRNTDFKFYEKRSLGVFTTKGVFAGEAILFVYHDEDGDWQFHTSDEPNLDDSMIVCLEDITRLDPTVNELFSLVYGGRAWRRTKEDA